LIDCQSIIKDKDGGFSIVLRSAGLRMAFELSDQDFGIVHA
jgi:hypothetical protein